MSSIANQSQEVNPLSVIIATANAAGRMVSRHIVHEAEAGTVMLRADQRGYLLLELWPKSLGPTSRLTIAYWNVNTSLWTLSTSQERTQEWLTEAAEILGEEPLPQALSPIDQAAADFVAQAGTDYDGRVARAVELVKAGQVEFLQYKTTFIPAGQSGHYECGCPDASRRGLRGVIGQICKHTIASHLHRTVTQAAETVAVRKLSDRMEMARQHRVPDYACRPGRMEDFLG